MTTTHLALALVSLAATGSLTACGGSDEGGSTASEKGCRTAVDATYPDGTTVSLDRAHAVALANGGAYTVYLGDYDIPTNDIATTTITPPAGAHQATIYLTPRGSLSDAEPIAEGAVVEYTSDADVLTFSTVLFADGTMSNQAVDAEGSLAVSELDEESLCLEVDYADAEKSITGRVAAPITATPY